MSHPTQQAPLELPPRLVGKLEDYRALVWKVKIAEGALAAVFGLLLSYLVVFGLDRLFDTPAPLRAALLALGSLGAAVGFPLKLHSWVWSRRRLDQVARLVRRRYPRFGDHLLGIVELAQSEHESGASRALAQAAMRQVDEELEGRDLTDAVPDPRHRRWAWMAAAPLVLTGTLLLVVPAAGRNALVRWLMPWRDVERYTFAQLDGEAEARVVPYAEPFEVTANLLATSPWKPDSATARYGSQAPVESERDGDAYRFELPPQTEPGRVLLAVGDARREIPVEPIARPALTTLTARVTLPEYLQRDEPLELDVRGGRVGLVEGSQAVFEMIATRELEEATFEGRAQTIDGAVVTTESVSVVDSAEYVLAWRDRFGLGVKEPQTLKVEAGEDEAPRVSLGALASGQVVLSNQTLTFELEAEDDFGVQRVGLEWAGIADPLHNPEPSVGEKFVAAGAPTAAELTGPATFSAERMGVRPQSLRLRAFAEDYLPGRARTYSPEVVLHVLTPAQHLEWLTEQLAEWTDAAQEVYEEELALHETNQELSKMSPEGLAQPDSQAQLQQQAAAEAANAAQLDALIDIGEELLSEATQNEEFDADQLEALAELLQTLEEIAEEQMPSVAELLAQAAEAPPPVGSEELAPDVYVDPDQEPITGESGEAEPSEELVEPEVQVSAPPGADDLGLEGAEKYGPEDLMPEGLEEDPKDPNLDAADVAQLKSEQAEGDPGYLPANPTPLVLDEESGFNESEQAEDAPQMTGGLGAPTTLLKGSGKDSEPEEEEAEEATASELVLVAVKEQEELLAAFAALAEELNELLAGFESTTFVKRLKAASRRQLDVATGLAELGGFGTPAGAVGSVGPRTELAAQQVAEADTLLTLQSDLAAYASRKPGEGAARVSAKMHEADVPASLQALSSSIAEAQVGRSTIECEHWADTLDRWAEELVPPSAEGEAGGHPDLIELPNLSPEMVLAIMRILDREVQLREEVRELDGVLGAIGAKDHAEQALALGITQAELAASARAIADEIALMPYAPDQNAATLQAELDELEEPDQDGRRLEGEELQAAIERVQNRAEFGLKFLSVQMEKLRKAAVVMDEVVGQLAAARTGNETNAAISEVIEILLETHRIPNAPMIVKVPPPTTKAQLLFGSGDGGSRASIPERAPVQATGKSGRVLPEEYRQGLDAYLNALEGGAE